MVFWVLGQREERALEVNQLLGQYVSKENEPASDTPKEHLSRVPGILADEAHHEESNDELADTLIIFLHGSVIYEHKKVEYSQDLHANDSIEAAAARHILPGDLVDLGSLLLGNILGLSIWWQGSVPGAIIGVRRRVYEWWTTLRCIRHYYFN